MPSSLTNCDQTPTRTCLGRIAQAHGIKGLVKLRPYGEDPQRLAGDMFTSETGDQTLTITLKNSLGKYYLAEIDGVSDRDQAEALRGIELWAARDILPEIENKDEFYVEDLIGLTALNADGQEIGKVISVENYGAGDLLDIQPPNGETYLVPFTKENVPDIDMDTRKITIVPLDI